MTAVKLCGLVREEDVRAAVQAGADYLGLNRVPASPRCLADDTARRLADAARDEAGRLGVAAPIVVGVYATALGEAADDARRCRMDAIQVHGAPPGSDVGEQGLPVIVAVRAHRGDPTEVPAGAWACLVDGHHDTLLGGTGRLADWDVAGRLAARCRLFLAGGLTPANVAAAVARVRPFAVDVASGVETSPGEKDHRLLRAFIEETRRADDRVHD